jgi:hypothetical protein
VPDPFYVLKVVDNPDGMREIYFLGPQFCGGEKLVIAHVHPSALTTARESETDVTLPKPLQDFLDWSDTLAVTRKAPKKVRTRPSPDNPIPERASVGNCPTCYQALHHEGPCE